MTILVLLNLTLVCFGGYCQQQPKEIAYKQVDDVTLKMRLFYPDDNEAGGERKYPAIVLFFGGGWAKGTMAQFVPQARYFASIGFIGITAEYRIATIHGTTPFEAANDAKSAVRYLREHADELGIAESKLAAGGGSAGGHLAAVTALTALDEPDEDESISSRPDALVLFNPVLDNGPGTYGHDLFGTRYTEISPYHNIKRHAAPTIIFLGTKDRFIPVEMAKRFQDKMKVCGNICELHLYEGQTHGFFNHRKDGDNFYFRDTLLKATLFLKSLGFAPTQPHETPPE